MAKGGPEKETAGKLLTHKAFAYKKYFVCWSEISTPIICFCLKITIL
jgi:hypothetical protein